MWKIKAVLITISIAVAFAFPADDKLDKATKNDVTLNLVTPKSGDKENQIRDIPKVSVTSSGAIGINSNPEADAPSRFPIEPPVSPPSLPKPGTMFARFIDDVFQIPITVLQSVTKLLTNPFTQRNKESSA